MRQNNCDQFQQHLQAKKAARDQDDYAIRIGGDVPRSNGLLSGFSPLRYAVRSSAFG